MVRLVTAKHPIERIYAANCTTVHHLHLEVNINKGNQYRGTANSVTLSRRRIAPTWIAP